MTKKMIIGSISVIVVAIMGAIAFGAYYLTQQNPQINIDESEKIGFTTKIGCCDGAKDDLKKSVDNVSGLPEQAFMQTANISAMSAFSTSAQSAMGQLRGQLIEGHKSKIAVTEEAAKVAELSKRLEWAKLVEEMSEESTTVP